MSKWKRFQYILGAPFWGLVWLCSELKNLPPVLWYEFKNNQIFEAVRKMRKRKLRTIYRNQEALEEKTETSVLSDKIDDYLNHQTDSWLKRMNDTLNKMCPFGAAETFMKELEDFLKESEIEKFDKETSSFYTSYVPFKISPSNDEVIDLRRLLEHSKYLIHKKINYKLTFYSNYSKELLAMNLSEFVSLAKRSSLIGGLKINGNVLHKNVIISDNLTLVKVEPLISIKGEIKMAIPVSTTGKTFYIDPERITPLPPPNRMVR